MAPPDEVDREIVILLIFLSVVQDAVGYCENEICIYPKRVYESTVVSIQKQPVSESKTESKKEAKQEVSNKATIAALRKGI